MSDQLPPLRRDDAVPVGLQLEWALRSSILTGRLGTEDRLPGLRAIADEAGVNVNTVRAVYTRLEADGLIETRHGAGSFVRRQPARARVGMAEACARAEQAAREAGLTHQQLAAALYMVPAKAPADPGLTNRRALRAQIAVLEEALSELHASHPELPVATTAPERAPGPRILDDEELVAARDAVLDRLVDARLRLREDAGEPTPTTDAEAATVKRRARPAPKTLGIAPA